MSDPFRMELLKALSDLADSWDERGAPLFATELRDTVTRVVVVPSVISAAPAGEDQSSGLAE